MARPPLYDEALRSRLLATATDVIERAGADALALRDVAAAAETSTSAVYALFGGKPQLVAAVLDAAFASFGASQRAAAPDGLRALGLAYRAWALEHPALYRLMFAAPGGPVDLPEQCDIEPAADIAMQPLQEAIALAQRAGRMSDVPVEIAATAIWGQVHGLVSLQLAGLGPAGFDWDAAYATVLDTITRAWSP